MPMRFDIRRLVIVPFNYRPVLDLINLLSHSPAPPLPPEIIQQSLVSRPVAAPDRGAGLAVIKPKPDQVLCFLRDPMQLVHALDVNRQRHDLIDCRADQVAPQVSYQWVGIDQGHFGIPACIIAGIASASCKRFDDVVTPRRAKMPCQSILRAIIGEKGLHA